VRHPHHPLAATHCNSLQPTATHCISLHLTATCCNKIYVYEVGSLHYPHPGHLIILHVPYSYTNCPSKQTAGALLHTTHVLQYTARQHVVSHCKILQIVYKFRSSFTHYPRTAIHCTMPQQAVSHCNTLQIVYTFKSSFTLQTKLLLSFFYKRASQI